MWSCARGMRSSQTRYGMVPCRTINEGQVSFRQIVLYRGTLVPWWRWEKGEKTNDIVGSLSLNGKSYVSLACYSLTFSGKDGPGGPEFAEYKSECESKHGIQFFTSLADLPPVAEGKKRLALVSGRTADNPRLLGESIKVRFFFHSRMWYGYMHGPQFFYLTNVATTLLCFILKLYIHYYLNSFFLC